VALSGTAGKRNGPKLPKVITFAVAADPATGISSVEVETFAEKVLNDPRSWTPIKKVTFARAPFSKARLRVRILTPKATDRFCAPFRTQSYKSCSKNWDVALNSDRWNFGSTFSQMPLGQYRIYLINHELGHSLGEEHRVCPAPGQRAPVMLQQTVGLKGCTPNPWPNPDAPIPTTTTITTPTTTVAAPVGTLQPTIIAPTIPPTVGAATTVISVPATDVVTSIPSTAPIASTP
jgi:hypothetical protein